MSFLYPQVLITLLLPALLAVASLASWRRRKRNAFLLVSPKHPELLQARPLYRTLLPDLLALLALAGVLCALARPINGYEPGEGRASGRNLLIALDISRSMETQDVKPSRLEEARAAAYELIEALPADKIGLIVFSGEADLVVPLTYDHTALRDALEQVNRGWAGYGGTNFGMLLRCALRAFARSAPDGANALVILSDGEDTVESSSDAVEEARKNHMLIVTVGIGTPTGAPIPDPEGENQLWQNAEGKHVISKLDVEALRRFAQSSGGSFFTMNSGADLTAFARETSEKLARHEESYAVGSSPRDLFAWFALPSLLLLVVSIILRSEWKAPRKLMLFLLLSSLSSVHAEEETTAPTPGEAYEAGLHAMQKAKVPKAQRLLSDALLSEDRTLQSAAHLALGNMQTRAVFDRLRHLYETSPDDAGKTAPKQPSPEELQSIVDELKKCLKPYNDALKSTPKFAPARNNTARVQELIKKLEEEIERLKQRQQQQNQQDRSQQQQNQQNEDKNQQQNNEQQQQNSEKNNNRQNQDQQKEKSDQQQQNQPNSDPNERDEKEQQDKNQQQDRQNEQDKQNGQDQQDDQQQKDDEQQNRTDPENHQQQQPQNQQDRSRQQRKPDQSSDREEQRAQEAEMSEEEKDKQRAAGILRMHTDEMGGSPIPHRNRLARPPVKDY